MTYQEISKMYRIPTDIVRQLSKVAGHDQTITLRLCDRYNLEYTQLSRGIQDDWSETLRRVIDYYRKEG